MKSLSVFFPAYNEEENIHKTVADAIAYLDTLHIDYEILVINDVSSDRTGEIVVQDFKDNPRVKLINNDTDTVHGYGSALRKGFASFTKDMVFFTDSDGQFDITELGSFLEKINSYDYVIGYRIDRSDPFYRNINATAYKFLVKLLLGVRVKDIDCAFKLFNANVIKSIEIKSLSALINAEILYRCNQKKYTFTEIGVHHFPRKFGKPTGADIKVILKMFKELFKMKMGLL